VFALSRNPIFLAMDLFLVGTALMSGRWIPAAVAVVALAGFHRQIRNEERFLEGHYGDAYRAYRNRVRRYFGRVDLMRGCST
jgi:protein-S-isoprenylcysteine O-methyltransferase Ste14